MSRFSWHRLRSKRYDELYVSPHLDDAVYSCGGQIAQRRSEGARILVLTVFANGRDDDQGEGVFGDIATRKREERAAMDLLDVDHMLVNLPDLIVRKKSLGDVVRAAIPFAEVGPSALQHELAGAVAAVRTRLLTPNAKLYFPLSIGAHPDHRVVFEVGSALANEPFVWFYEDVPYAEVRALRDERLHQLGLAPPRFRLANAGETHDFFLAHTPLWKQPFTRSVSFAHWATMQVLSRMRAGDYAARYELQRDITDVIATKVAAIRAYATQTAYFYPEGDAIYARLSRAGERYVERYWQLTSPHAGPDDPAQRRRSLAELDAQLA